MLILCPAPPHCPKHHVTPETAYPLTKKDIELRRAPRAAQTEAPCDV
jgi:hypothetical protein